MTEYAGSWEWKTIDGKSGHKSNGIVTPQGMEWQQTQDASGLPKNLASVLLRIMHHCGFYIDLLTCPACGSTKVKPSHPGQKGWWHCKPCNEKPNTIAGFNTAAESHLAKCYRCGGKGFMQFQCKKWCQACHGRGWLRV